MSLLRFVARSMLASYFLINGVKAFRHPEEFVPDAQPLADRLLPLVNANVPESARGYLPEDATGLVKFNGALLAAQDTEGKPTIAWRVRTQKQLLAKEAAKRKAELERDARGTAEDAARFARKSMRKARKGVEGVLS